MATSPGTGPGAAAASRATPPRWLEAAARAFGSRLAHEWRGTPMHEASLAWPRATGLAARPRDFRPPDPALGTAVRAGRFDLAGATLDVGPGGDPWDRPSPSRQFAVQLHRFAWLPALLASGVEGGWEALRLTLAWRALFDRPSPFAWGADTLERRVYNLACGISGLAAPASDREAEALAQALARQARHLLALDPGPARRAERLAAVAVAGCALAGAAGERLLGKALPRLNAALGAAVLPDGGLRTRSPEQGLELWFDLATLDDALLQRGRETPAALAGAMDRLAGAVRFFTLPDGRLAAFNGGGAATLARVGAARPEHLAPTAASPYAAAPHAAYQRLEGESLVVMVDAGAAPADGWSVAACAQPLGLEIAADGERLVCSGGWTPDVAAPAGLRLTAAGSTLTRGDGSAGRPLTGFAARALGPRLEGAVRAVAVKRETVGEGVWLELSHEGWGAGVVHDRRLYLDARADELRGEDRLAGGGPANDVAVRFHLPPDVRASLARDGRSVLLRGPSDRGWWLRNDAAAVVVEPDLHVEGGVARRSLAVTMTPAATADGARLRWKLGPVDPPRPRPRPPTPPAPTLEPAP